MDTNHLFNTTCLFHPKRHILPTNPSDDLNMSPVDRKTFSICRSIQNAQLLTYCDGVKKYVYKYIDKIDESNYIIVNADGKGQLAATDQEYFPSPYKYNNIKHQ